MNCRKARSAAIWRELGRLPASRSSALDLHLQECSACADALKAEQRMIAELALLGAAPVEVDVAARVMAAIEPHDRVSRDEVPARQLGWAAVAAGLGALIVAASFGGQLPKIEALLQSGAAIALNLLGFADALLAPVWALISIPFRLLGAVGEWLIGLAPQASRALPFARAGVAFGYLVMASTVLLVVIRDLRRPAASLRGEGNYR